MRLNQVLEQNLLSDDLITEMPAAPLDANGEVKSLTPNTSEYTDFLSKNSLDRDYKLVKEAPDYSVYINNEHDMAIIGKMGNRPSKDRAFGIAIYVTVDFKDKQVISTSNPSAQLKGALQVEMVAVHKKNMGGRNYASLMYYALAELGITIISDNTQFRGGKELWKKLARNAAPHFQVNIIEDARVRLDENNKPFIYDGSNLPDDELWSGKLMPQTPPEGYTPAGLEMWHAWYKKNQALPDKTMTLFVLRKAS